MIALYVVLALLALILFLLFVNIHIIFVYREKAQVIVRILFLRMDGMHLFSYFTREKEGGEEKEQTQSEKPQAPKKKRKADPLGFVEFLLRITRVVSLAVKEHLSKMRIHLKELCVIIGTDDAAKTAMLTGGAIQAANFLCVLLQRFSHFTCDNRNLVISPDFTSEQSRFTVHLDLTVKAYHLITIFMRAYFRLFEGKDEHHARNSVKTSH